MGRKFVIKEATRRRCHIIAMTPSAVHKLHELSLEQFRSLYDTDHIDFSIYFRAEQELIEFIRPDEFSRTLLDQMSRAITKAYDNAGIFILKKDLKAWRHFNLTVRQKKIDAVLEKEPYLDRKTLEAFNDLTSVSQMVVRGGLTQDVVRQAASATESTVDHLFESEAAIATLSRMITVDPTLYDHSASVAMIGGAIAGRILAKPLPKPLVQLVARCGLYHDVGKTCIAPAVLNKPGRFTEDEFEVMKQHTHLGYDELQKAIQEGAPIEEVVARVALEHHEKFCGSGYPNRKCGRAEDDPDLGIHLFSRIVTIADVYSALLMARVYKPAYEASEAIRIMANEDADRYDPEIFHPFLKDMVTSLSLLAEKKSEMQRSKGRILMIENGQIKIR